MHFEFLASYWWAIIAALAAIMLLYVFIAGRGAQGGLSGRAALGWSRWRALSRKAADIQARVILTLFYFTVAAPFGLARTYLADPLSIKKARRDRAWVPRRTRDLTVDDARRQY
jgi:hypothetical protein